MGMIQVSSEDAHLLEHKHFVTKNGYVCGRFRDGRLEYLHRVVADAPAGQHVDHANGDKLDCRRENLRHATRTQNNINVTRKKSNRYVGVYPTPGSSTWMAHISINGKRTYLGSWPSAEEAAKARDDVARKHHGEFAVLNFPLEN